MTAVARSAPFSSEVTGPPKTALTPWAACGPNCMGPGGAHSGPMADQIVWGLGVGSLVPSADQLPKMVCSAQNRALAGPKIPPRDRKGA